MGSLLIRVRLKVRPGWSTLITMDTMEVAGLRVWEWYELPIDTYVMITVLANELTGSFYPASRMKVHKQAPETSFGAEVYHQASLVIDAHARWIQRTWQKYIQAIKTLQNLSFSIQYARSGARKHELWYYSDLRMLPWSSACGGLPMPSFHRMAVSYTKVSRNSDCRSKCCQPPVPTGEWNT